jgi:hypothetical protein
MARSHIQEEASSYYPPRARWYAPVFTIFGSVRRRLALDRLVMSGEVNLGRLFAGFLVPGLAVWLRGPKLWGQAALAASALLVLIFIVGLGYAAGNIAFGLLISLHCSGFVYCCNPLLAGERFSRRLAFTFLVLLALGLVVYQPARHFVQQHWLTPLRLHGQVIVVERMVSARNVHRGDWIAYEMADQSAGDPHHGGEIVVDEGMGLGPVLAVAGDVVTFSAGFYSVNGVEWKSLPHMPVSGGFTVPEKHWFIWPNLDISGHGNIAESSISATLVSLAEVGETQYFGKPFHRWFGRKQILP